MARLRISDDLQIGYAEHGPGDAPAVVFAHGLGLDRGMWDDLVPLLPKGLRVVRLDMRGHGQSTAPPAPYAMGALIRDTEEMLEALEIRDCVFVGLSIGGMIAQGLAAKRLDLVRALVLSNTAPKIATREVWADRIAAVEVGGTQAVAVATLHRWFAAAERNSPAAEKCRETLLATSTEGFAGCAAAIAGTDFYTTTAALRLPCMVIAGSEDGSTPPDMVREMADLIPGSDYHLIRGAGHLPPVDHPQDFAALLTDFLKQIGHLE